MQKNKKNQADISKRKARHLDICVDPKHYQVESGNTRLDEVHFIHTALPELNVDDIDPAMDFCGHRISMPFFISSMTGGAKNAYRANQELARAAQEEGVGVGMGSIRILFRHPEYMEQFSLRRLAPDVPIFANLGAVQIRDMKADSIHEMLKRLEVSALAIHVNPGQELFQSGGDRDFRGVFEGICRFTEKAPVPIIVKETGFGIHPELAHELLNSGVDYVNVAGSGGTNWISVESYREDAQTLAVAEEFREWGQPTALLLAALPTQLHPRILASGGLRSGMDMAKTIAMGAAAAGTALPLIRAVHKNGREEVQKLIQGYRRTLISAMALTGSKTLDAFRKGKVWYNSSLSTDARLLQEKLEKQGSVK